MKDITFNYRKRIPGQLIKWCDRHYLSCRTRGRSHCIVGKCLSCGWL